MTQNKTDIQIQSAFGDGDMKQGMILLGLALLLSGCSTFYYGYSKEEWESLTKLEQERAKHAYKDVRYAHQQNIYGAPADDASKAFVERALKSTNDSPR